MSVCMEEEIIVFSVLMVFVVVLFALQVVINIFYYKCLNEVPEKYRVMKPPLVFLNLVPCLNLVWIFIVVNRISRSYQNFFATLDDPHVKNQYGDCAGRMGLAYALLSLLSSVPYIGCLSFFPNLIVFGILLFRYNEMRKFAQVANALK